MSDNRSTYAFVICLALLAGIQTAGGQLRGEDCTARVSRAQSASAGNVPAMLRECGPAAGEALARVIRGLARVTDTMVFTHALTADLLMFRDARVLDALADVASDPSASVLGRTAAVRFLVSQYMEGGMIDRSWHDLLTGSSNLTISLPSGLKIHTGAPLGADAPMRIAAALDSVFFDETAPRALRNLARETRARVKEVPQPSPRIDPARVVAEYRCDNTFLVYLNDTTYGVWGEYVHPDSAHRLRVFLPPKPATGLQVMLTLPQGESLRLLVNGQHWLPPVPMGARKCVFR